MRVRHFKRAAVASAIGCAAIGLVASGQSPAAATARPEGPGLVTVSVPEVSGFVAGAIGELGGVAARQPDVAENTIMVEGFVYSSIGELAPGLGTSTAG